MSLQLCCRCCVLLLYDPQVAVKMVPVMHDGDSLDSRNLHMLRHEVKVCTCMHDTWQADPFTSHQCTSHCSRLSARQDAACALLQPRASLSVWVATYRPKGHATVC